MKHTYQIRISPEAIEYRILVLSLIDGVEIKRQDDELDFTLTCGEDAIEMVEYELRKSERRDDFCEWKKI